MAPSASHRVSSIRQKIQFQLWFQLQTVWFVHDWCSGYLQVLWGNMEEPGPLPLSPTQQGQMLSWEKPSVWSHRTCSSLQRQHGEFPFSKGGNLTGTVLQHQDHSALFSPPQISCCVFLHPYKINVAHSVIKALHSLNHSYLLAGLLA